MSNYAPLAAALLMVAAGFAGSSLTLAVQHKRMVAAGMGMAGAACAIAAFVVQSDQYGIAIAIFTLLAFVITAISVKKKSGR